jgi:hypothetical protein
MSALTELSLKGRGTPDFHKEVRLRNIFVLSSPWVYPTP